MADRNGCDRFTRKSLRRLAVPPGRDTAFQGSNHPREAVVAEKDKQTDVKDSQEGELLPVGPEADDEPQPVDVDHEHSIKVSKMMADGFYDKLAAEATHGTTQDGLEDAPSHREGEVWESMAPEDDELGGGRRRLRVQSVEGGEVTAVNLVTGVVSHFQAENLVGPRWRRAHS